MSLLRSEPFAAVETMDELLAIAFQMEQEAISNYSDLADRMRREGRPDMVSAFKQLAGEEAQHLDNVVQWSERTSGSKPDLAKLKWEPADTSMTGRERHRARAAERVPCVFDGRTQRRKGVPVLTYVAAQTDQEELRIAAEQMAREKLGHLSHCAGAATCVPYGAEGARSEIRTAGTRTQIS